MWVSLLAHSVRPPDSGQRFYDWVWICPFLNPHFLDKPRVRALIATLFPLTLHLMVFIYHQFPEWYCVRQTLHDCIEKTGVTVILHRESTVVFVFCAEQSISLLGFHHFKAARVTAFGQTWQTWWPNNWLLELKWISAISGVWVKERATFLLRFWPETRRLATTIEWMLTLAGIVVLELVNARHLLYFNSN